VVWQKADPANVAVQHYASVSRQPVIDPAAQAEVMAAVRALQPEGGVPANGDPVVAIEEVTTAMVSSRPGTSPGPNGLPLTFYKVMANRMRPALEAVTSPTQTAFLKGRRSGANILTLQLLVEGLLADSEVVAALLDFAKAYDTIDRGFLLSVLKELGMGEAICGCRPF
jgi:hypothetical protein